jgi:hypothetical protein
MEGQSEAPLSPAGNGSASRADEPRPGGRGGRLVREDGVAGAGVDEETPVRQLVHNVDQGAGGDGVEAPPELQFPQLQGWSQFLALSP